VTLQCPKYAQQMSLLDWSLSMEEVILKPPWGRLDAIEWHPPIGNERRSNIWYKDDPVPSQNQGVPRLNPRPRVPTKVSFKGGSPPSTSNPFFFLASPNLEDEISFKGASLSHPKILECENK
jgi:hypothetical protein